VKKVISMFNLGSKHVRSACLIGFGATLASSLAMAQGLLPPPRDAIPPLPEDAPAATPTFWPLPPAHETPPAPPVEAVPDPPPPPAPPASPPPAQPPIPQLVVARPDMDLPSADAWTHDRLYLHLSLGLGGLGSSAQANNIKQEVGGGALSLNVAAGWTVARRLIVFAEWYGSAAGKAKTKVNGVELASDAGDASLSGLGLGVAYYFQRNIFVSGGLGVSHFRVATSDGDTRYQSKGGLGLHASVGKEWWVSEQWGLGIAAALATVSAEDRDLPGVEWRAATMGLAFVATYN
jgi:hypothetical protein